MSAPQTRSQKGKAVRPSTPSPPRTRRFRTLAAAIASGSPLSSSSESVSSHDSPQSDKIDSSQVVPPLTQTAGAGGSGLPPFGAHISDVASGATTPMASRAASVTSVAEDVTMQSASGQDLSRALRELAARLPVTRDAAEQKVDELKGKIDTATSDDGVITAFPRDFQSDVRDFVKGYRLEVETLANARSSLHKLLKHKSKKTFPVALNSIKNPTIQFSRVYKDAPSDQSDRGTYPTYGSRVRTWGLKPP
jgi:hypothetical protein